MSKRDPKRIYVYERKREGKASLWYARFRGDNGKMGSPLCTDAPDREKAIEWANNFVFDHGGAPSAHRPRVQSFADWAKPWWRFETCPYVRERIANGFTVSRAYVESRRRYLDLHLIPEFGKDAISALTPVMFRDFKMRLLKEARFAPGTINKIIGTARIMFGYAFKMEELDSNPLAPVDDLKETPKRRGILTPDELRRMFGPAAKDHVWKGDLRYYAINMLAADTGMRMGECQALRVQDIDPDGFIRVDHSWNRYGLTPPKWNSERIIPLARLVRSAISELLAFGRWGDPLPTDFIFWGDDRNTPLTEKSVLRAYKAALGRIGITEEEQKRRNLVFHSWRHGFNAYLRGKVPDEQLRRVTGHRSVAMTDRYDHVRVESLGDILAEQEKLLTFEEIGS